VLRIAGYSVVLAAFALALLDRTFNLNFGDRFILVALFVTLAGFPIACALDFLFRRNRTLPPILCWLLRAAALVVWLYVANLAYVLSVFQSDLRPEPPPDQTNVAIGRANLVD